MNPFNFQGTSYDPFEYLVANMFGARRARLHICLKRDTCTNEDFYFCFFGRNNLERVTAAHKARLVRSFCGLMTPTQSGASDTLRLARARLTCVL